MPPLQPFDKHEADTQSLDSCGSTLVNRAAESITNRKLTRTAYSPAIGAIRGDRALLVQHADRAVQHNATQVHGDVVWAAVVSRYWSAKVSGFNAEVDRITSALANDTSTDDASGSATGDGKTARERAKEAWWKAHRLFIEDGGRDAAAMLRDGPTRAHLERAVDAGAIPPMQRAWPGLDDYWNGFKGSWLPPGGANINTRIWAGKTVALGTVWPGFAMDRRRTHRSAPLPAPYAVFTSTGWRSRFNPHNWQPRYNMPRYAWTRNPPTFRRGLARHTRWGAPARFATTKVFYSFTFAGGAYDQWQRNADRADLNSGERVTRSATCGATKLVGTYAGIEIAALLGGTIGSFAGPYGTVAGIVIGGLVGGAIGSGIADEVGDHVVEAVTDPLETLEDVGDAVTFWN